jgi:Rrf2 family protein
MISQTAEYAIRALSYIVANGRDRRILSREISAEIGVPANYLSKILHNLVRARILGSSRGASGGFQLVCDPATVSLVDIVHLFDGVVTRRECFLGQATCSDENPCQVHDRWKPVICSYLEFLEKTSLSEMGERRTSGGAPEPPSLDESAVG